MALIASLVVGANGATSLAGKSSPLSTPSDRAKFLERHRSAAAFIIGRQSALIENYSSNKVPIFVLSRSSEAIQFPHPLMHQITVNHGELAEIVRGIDQRIEGDIVVEAGASLLTALIEVGAIDVLELSISPIEGDGNFFPYQEILRNFEYTEEVTVDGTRLLQCRYKGDPAHS